jgi:hypothetical protein
MKTRKGVAVLHLSPETEALIRAKADANGTTPDELLRRTFAPDQKSAGRKPDVERMKAIASRTARLPLLDRRTTREIADEGWGL